MILTGQGHDHRCEGTSAGAVSQESGRPQQRGDVTLALEGACQAEKDRDTLVESGQRRSSHLSELGDLTSSSVRWGSFVEKMKEGQ